MKFPSTAALMKLLDFTRNEKICCTLLLNDYKKGGAKQQVTGHNKAPNTSSTASATTSAATTFYGTRTKIKQIVSFARRRFSYQLRKLVPLCYTTTNVYSFTPNGAHLYQTTSGRREGHEPCVK